MKGSFSLKKKRRVEKQAYLSVKSQEEKRKVNVRNRKRVFKVNL